MERNTQNDFSKHQSTRYLGSTRVCHGGHQSCFGNTRKRIGVFHCQRRPNNPSLATVTRWKLEPQELFDYPFRTPKPNPAKVSDIVELFRARGGLRHRPIPRPSPHQISFFFVFCHPRPLIFLYLLPHPSLPFLSSHPKDNSHQSQCPPTLSPSPTRT